MTAGHIEYTWEIKEVDSNWNLIPAYTVTVMARPNDRITALRWVHNWVTSNSDKRACDYTYVLKNADLPCYDDNALPWVELVSAEVHTVGE